MPVSHAMTDWLDPYRTTIAGKTVPGAFQWQTELDRALENASQAAADPLLRNFHASRFIHGPANSPNWHLTRLKYEQAATEGDRAAQYFLGLMYLSGKGTAIQPDKAFDWLLQAARQNLPEAQYWLADCYARGRGTLQSDREAVRWYRIAAENGHAVSQTAIGLALLYGIGLEKNEKEAAIWLEKASVAGNARAQYYRFRQLANGLGVPKDPERADHWLIQSAEGGWQEARVIVAARDILRYSERKDNPEQATRAVVWLGEAAARNDRNALYLLGTLYYTGTLVDKNHALAAECFLRAAHAGHRNAQRTVGALYRKRHRTAQRPRQSLPVVCTGRQKQRPRRPARARQLLPERYRHSPRPAQRLRPHPASRTSRTARRPVPAGTVPRNRYRHPRRPRSRPPLVHRSRQKRQPASQSPPSDTGQQVRQLPPNRPAPARHGSPETIFLSTAAPRPNLPSHPPPSTHGTTSRALAFPSSLHHSEKHGKPAIFHHIIAPYRPPTSLAPARTCA